jgi:transcriptional regulator with XRE-family HTH domain
MHEGEVLRSFLKGLPNRQMGEIAIDLSMSRQNLNYHLRRDILDPDFERLLKDKMRISKSENGFSIIEPDISLGKIVNDQKTEKKVSTGDNIRTIRISWNLSIDDVGKITGISKDQIMSIEDGAIPTEEELKTIATKFRISITDLKETDLTKVYTKDYYLFVGKELKRIFESNNITNREFCQAIPWISEEQLDKIKSGKLINYSYFELIRKFFAVDKLEDLKKKKNITNRIIKLDKPVDYPSEDEEELLFLIKGYKKKFSKKHIINRGEDIKKAREWEDLTLYELAGYTNVSRDKIGYLEQGGYRDDDDDVVRRIKPFFKERHSLYADYKFLPDYLSEKSLIKFFQEGIKKIGMSNLKELLPAYKSYEDFFADIKKGIFVYDIDVNDKDSDNDSIRNIHYLYEFIKRFTGKSQIIKRVDENGKTCGLIDLEDFIEIPYFNYSYDFYLKKFLNGTLHDALPKIIYPRPIKEGNYLIYWNGDNVRSNEFEYALLDGDWILCRELDKEFWPSPIYHTKYPFLVVHREGFLVGIVSHDIKNNKFKVLSGKNNLHSKDLFIDDIYQMFYVIKVVDRDILLLNQRGK